MKPITKLRAGEFLLPMLEGKLVCVTYDHGPLYGIVIPKEMLENYLSHITTPLKHPEVRYAEWGVWAIWLSDREAAIDSFEKAEEKHLIPVAEGGWLVYADFDADFEILDDENEGENF